MCHPLLHHSCATITPRLLFKLPFSSSPHTSISNSFLLYPVTLPFSSSCHRRLASSSQTITTNPPKSKTSSSPRSRMIKAPAAERNKQPILDVLSSLFAKDTFANVLEIASGTGQHVIHFAQHFHNMTFTPTDYESDSVQVIAKNISCTAVAAVTANPTNNIRPPVVVDVSLPVDQWPDSVKSLKYDLMICSNMIHISPWKCSLGLFAAASLLLTPSGRLITYGPYAENGVLEPESNRQFDQYLKSQNPEWGVRDIKDISLVAISNQLFLKQKFDMPANNKILLFERN